MDALTKRRLILGLISNWISKVAGSVIQFVQVFVFCASGRSRYMASG